MAAEEGARGVAGAFLDAVGVVAAALPAADFVRGVAVAGLDACDARPFFGAPKNPSRDPWRMPLRVSWIILDAS